MPYSMCPLCGTVSHLSTCDHKTWYETYHPGVPFGKIVPGKCFYCFGELRNGDTVVIRNPSKENAGSVATGDRGILEETYTSTDGSLYLVRMQNGKECYFVRSEIRGLVGKEKDE